MGVHNTHTAIQNILDRKTATLEYITGKTPSGLDQYVYLLLPKNKRQAFRNALASLDTHPSDWGVVIASGTAPPPPNLEAQTIQAIKGDLGPVDE